jgi:hypothetical protein
MLFLVKKCWQLAYNFKGINVLCTKLQKICFETGSKRPSFTGIKNTSVNEIKRVKRGEYQSSKIGKRAI